MLLLNSGVKELFGGNFFIRYSTATTNYVRLTSMSITASVDMPTRTIYVFSLAKIGYASLVL
jgi:hypothetical protein